MTVRSVRDVELHASSRAALLGRLREHVRVVAHVVAADDPGRRSRGSPARARSPGRCPTLTATSTPQINWQVSVGEAGPGIAPAITTSAVYAAATDGTLTRLDAATGRACVAHQRRTARCRRGRAPTIRSSCSAPTRATCSRSTRTARRRGLRSVSSEVIAPPRVADKVVIVFSGDGRIYGLAVADGKTLWVNQRTNPPLTVRNAAGGVVTRGGLFVGTAGGRLLALDAQTGTIG